MVLRNHQDSTMPSTARSSFDPNGAHDALPRAVTFLKVLGHARRLEILCHLIDGERSVGELTAAIGTSQPAVSQQLMRLRADGLVTTQRQGKSILYAIARPEISKVVSALRDAFCPSNGDLRQNPLTM